MRRVFGVVRSGHILAVRDTYDEAFEYALVRGMEEAGIVPLLISLNSPSGKGGKF